MAQITVVDQNNSPIDIDENDLEDYKSAGFTPDTPELAAQRAEKEKYGTGLQEAGAGLEGLAAGATGGLSHYAETGLGITTPEDIEKRKEANPNLEGAAEAAGFVGSLAVPGVGEESGALGTLAKVATAPVKGIEALGKGVSKGVVEKILSGVGLKETGAVSQVISEASNMAAQTAGYNALQQIDENHLAGGDLTQGVEKALASTPDALELGAALGAGTKLGGIGIKLLGAKVSQGINSIRENLPKYLQPAVDKVIPQLQAATGLPEDELKGMLSNPGTVEGLLSRTDVTANERDQIHNALENQVKELSDNSIKLQKAASKMRDEETPNLINEYVEGFKKKGGRFSEYLVTTSAQEEAQKIYDQFTDQILKMQQEPEMYKGSILGQLENVANGLKKKLAKRPGAGEVFNILDDMKSKALDPFLKWDALKYTAADRNAIGVAKGLTQLIRNNLEDENIYGPAGIAQDKYNKAFADLQTAKKPFNKMFSVKDDGSVDPQLFKTKVNTVLNKLGAERGGQDIIDNYLKANDNYVNAVNNVAKNVGSQFVDRQGIESLQETSEKLYQELHGTLRPMTEDIYNDFKPEHAGMINRLAPGSKQRALANTPFVSASPLSIINKHQTLGQIGSIIGGSAGIAAGGPIGAGIGATIGAGVGGLANKVLNIATNPHEARSTLALVERFILKTSKNIESGVGKFFTRGGKIIESAKPLMAYEINKHLNYHDEFKKQLDFDTNSFAQANQGKYFDKGIVDPIAVHAPNFVKSASEKQEQIQKYLIDEFPKQPFEIISLDPKFNLYKPSKAEMQDWLDKKELATKPLTLLDKLNTGTLADSDIQVMQELWPKILEHIQTSAIKKLANLTEDISIKQKNQLGILLGKPVDDSFTPEMSQFMSNSFQTQQSQKAAQTQNEAKGEKTLASSFQTSTQRLSSK